MNPSDCWRVVARGRDHDHAVADRHPDGLPQRPGPGRRAQRHVDHLRAVPDRVPDPPGERVLVPLVSAVHRETGLLLIEHDPDGQDGGVRRHPEHARGPAGAAAVPGDQRRDVGPVPVRRPVPRRVHAEGVVRARRHRSGQVRRARVGAGVQHGHGHAAPPAGPPGRRHPDLGQLGQRRSPRLPRFRRRRAPLAGHPPGSAAFSCCTQPGARATLPSLRPPQAPGQEPGPRPPPPPQPAAPRRGSALPPWVTGTGRGPGQSAAPGRRRLAARPGGRPKDAPRARPGPGGRPRSRPWPAPRTAPAASRSPAAGPGR